MAVAPEHTEKQWLQEDGGAVVFLTIRYARSLKTLWVPTLSSMCSLRTESHMVSSGVASCPLREVSWWNRTCCLFSNSRPAHDWTHLWTVGSHLWQALKMRAPSNGTGKSMGIFLRSSRDSTENIALVAYTVMDMTASTVNSKLFIHCRSNWGSPSLFSAIPLWLWVAGQN